jgi:hypothetical protein
MESELFVINSVKTSERAFSAVAEYIPSMDVSALLKVLQDRHKLRQAATAMRVDDSKVFTYLQQAIMEAFSRRAMPQLTREHVRLLLNADVQRLLSGVLGCSPQEALQRLFSIPALQDTLDYLAEGRVARLPTNATQLVSEILRPLHAQKLEFDYTTTENSWESILKNEEWLSPASAALLMQSDKFKSARTPFQVLAELVDQSQEREEDTSEIDLYRSDIIRPLGLLELRRRLSWIISRLQDQALDDAGKAATNMPASPCLQLLPPLLHLYKMGAIAKGVKAYINHTHLLLELLPKDSFVGVKVDQASVVRDHALIFSGESQFTVADREVGTLEIKCVMHTQRNPQLILRAHDVPVWVYNQLQHDIPRLTPNDLSPIGNELYENLICTSFPILEPQVHLLKKAVEQLGDQFVQAVALSCESPVEQIPELWREIFIGHRPYQDLPAKVDPLYPEGVEQIIARHQRYYNQAYYPLQIIRGVEAADSADGVEPS